jgi:predicted phosphodiesterase
MADTIKSFHSAAHSLVQAAVAAQLKGSAASAGIAVANGTMREVSAILATFPHRRSGDPRTRMVSSPLGTASPLSGECLALIYDYAVARLEGNTAAMAEIESEFKMSTCDVLGWASAALEYIAHLPMTLSYVKAPSPPDDSFVLALPEQDAFRIGILGDWGTGESVAQNVVDAVMATSGLDLIVHVGDVYYAGTADEAQSNFLGMIASARASTGCRVPVYNLPGNHDYYTKGKPFYDALASVNVGAAFPKASPAPVQHASFFVLRNSWLQLEGMDTGYFDSDLFDVDDDTTRLHHEEAAWHLYQLNQAATAKRAVFLFSHHQAWSAFLGIGEGRPTPAPAEAAASAASMPLASYNVHLQKQLAAAPPNTVRAWFWGHEHVLEVYDQAAITGSTVPTDAGPKPLSTYFPWLGYGACIGHSAFPMLKTDDANPYAVVAPGIKFNPAYTVGTTTSNGATVYNRGYTILDVTRGTAAPTAVATYYWLPGDGSPAQPAAFPPSTIA